MTKNFIKDIEDSIANHEDFLDDYIDRFDYRSSTAWVEFGIITGLKEALNWIRMEIGDEE